MCKMIHYDFIRENCSDSEIGEYVSYGIVVFRISGEAKETLCTVHDAFLSERKASEFTERCNKLGLSPVHIYDAVQDAIE